MERTHKRGRASPLDLEAMLARLNIDEVVNELDEADARQLLGDILRAAQRGSSDLQDEISGAVTGLMMSTLPPEVMERIALQLPYRSVLALCSTNQAFAAICRREVFWRDKARADFGTSYRKYPTWRESYRMLTRQPPAGTVAIGATLPGNRERFRTLPVKLTPDDYEPCEPVYIAFPSRSWLRHMTTLIMPGSDGYPVIATLDEAGQTDDTIYMHVNDEFIMDVYYNPLGAIINLDGATVANRVIQFYGLDAYEAWEDACPDQYEGLNIPHPLDIWPELSVAEGNAKLRDLFRLIWISPPVDQ